MFAAFKENKLTKKKIETYFLFNDSFGWSNVIATDEIIELNNIKKKINYRLIFKFMDIHLH
jgi:hypothetical protein